MAEQYLQAYEQVDVPLNGFNDRRPAEGCRGYREKQHPQEEENW